MKSVKDLLPVLDRTNPFARAIQEFPLPRGPRTRRPYLVFRRQPKRLDATGAMAALSHVLAQRGRHWDYADTIARRMFAAAAVEDLRASQIVQIIAAIRKTKENQ